MRGPVRAKHRRGERGAAGRSGKRQPREGPSQVQTGDAVLTSAAAMCARAPKGHTGLFCDCARSGTTEHGERGEGRVARHSAATADHFRHQPHLRRLRLWRDRTHHQSELGGGGGGHGERSGCGSDCRHGVGPACQPAGVREQTRAWLRSIGLPTDLSAGSANRQRCCCRPPGRREGARLAAQPRSRRWHALRALRVRAWSMSDSASRPSLPVSPRQRRAPQTGTPTHTYTHTYAHTRTH